MLAEQLKSGLMQAMRDKDAVRKDILRVALGELQTIATRQGKDLTDPEQEQVIRKLIKSNQETLDAARPQDDADRLRAEIAVLEAFLPKTLNVEQIAAALAPVADAIRAAGNDGQAIGIAMKTLKASGANVTGQDVATTVKSMRA